MVPSGAHLKTSAAPLGDAAIITTGECASVHWNTSDLTQSDPQHFQTSLQAQIPGGIRLDPHMHPRDAVVNRTTTIAKFSTVTAGTFNVCYNSFASRLNESVQRIGTITVNAVPPTSFEILAAGTNSTHQTLRFTGGSGLSLGPAQDSAKLVSSPGSCADAASSSGDQISQISNLNGPWIWMDGEVDGRTDTSDMDGRLVADAVFKVTAGTFIACYKIKGSTYVQVGTKVSVGQAPSDWVELSDDGTVLEPGTTHIFATGNKLIQFFGIGLNVMPGGDSAKIVERNASCADAGSIAFSEDLMTVAEAVPGMEQTDNYATHQPRDHLVRMDITVIVHNSYAIIVCDWS